MNHTPVPGTITGTITGMTCGHCVASVTEEVGELAGVSGVDVDLASGAITVTGEVTVEAVAAAVVEAGYTFTADAA